MKNIQMSFDWLRVALLLSKISRSTTFMREFRQIAMAGAATAIAVEEVWGEYVAVAHQNSTLSNAKYKQYGAEVLKLTSIFEEVFVRLKTLNDFVQRHKGFYFTLL